VRFFEEIHADNSVDRASVFVTEVFTYDLQVGDGDFKFEDVDLSKAGVSKGADFYRSIVARGVDDAGI